MGILSFFQSGPKIVHDIFDKDSGHLAKFGAWIGNQSFTDEERAEFTRKFVIDTLAENTDRSKARRQIAVTVIRFYLGLLAASGATYLINTEWSAMLFSLSTSGGLVGLVTGVSLFFFGTHLFRSTKYGADDKK